MKKLFPLLLALAPVFAHAQSIDDSPPLIPSFAGLIPSHDGAFKVIVLHLPPGGGWQQTFCEKGWRSGVIHLNDRSPLHKAAFIGNPGCWGEVQAKSGDIEFEFRFIEISTPPGGLKKIRINPASMGKFMYEWRTQRLFPMQ